MFNHAMISGMPKFVALLEFAFVSDHAINTISFEPSAARMILIMVMHKASQLANEPTNQAQTDNTLTCWTHNQHIHNVMHLQMLAYQVVVP
jgi:hypothetical protein